MTYFKLPQLIEFITSENKKKLARLLTDNWDVISKSVGSSKNHQAWEGGFLHHTIEVMNIAYWMYQSCPRKLSFTLSDVFEVLLLHDLEKPWNYAPTKGTRPVFRSKEDRKLFRDRVIQEKDIQLTTEQWNALTYIEGVPDRDYTPNERVMGELATFCHCCDILSARLWYNKGKEGEW